MLSFIVIFAATYLVYWLFPDIKEWIIDAIIAFVVVVIDIGIAIKDLTATLWMWFVYRWTLITDHCIIGATIDGKTATWATRLYYDKDPYLTTASAFRWLRRYNNASQPTVLTLLYRHKGIVRHAVIDLEKNLEMQTMTLLPNDSIELSTLSECSTH